ncbi:Probable RNA-directed DNA polymerase from transposon BS [Eumeta japonica]|uniref:Probable RNA-directed DNA polymerase from transposon BS n=1 Tax=Eumeta variegata TaxID=151549 RepID=A0A4C1WX33_EUMVA|nr:Probable RNA-directed DNA polymerase from transposon BS [Eumeta japonica]
MEATGCRLAMTEYVHSSWSRSISVSKRFAPARPKSPLCLRGCRHPLRIPNDIASTDEIDLAIGALTNHVRTVVEESEREVPASSDRRKFRRYSRIDKSKNAALRRASAYPTPEYRSRARALQRSESSRSGIRNESWSDLMEEIKPSTKRFGQLPKRSKPRDIPLYPHSKPDNSVAIDDAEIAECLADSIETQCSRFLRTTSLISVASRKRFSKNFLEPKDDLAPVSLSEVQTLVKSLNTRKAPGLDGSYRHPQARETTRPPCQLQTDQPPERSGQTIRKILKTRLSDHLLGKGLIIDEQFGFRPAHSCPQQVLRLVEHERTHSTRRLIRAGVPQGSTLSPLLYSAYTNDVPRPSSSGVQLALFADDTALFTEIGIGAPDSPPPLQRPLTS